MSFVDTVGPFVLCVLLGLAALIAAAGVWIGYTAKHISTSRDVLRFNRDAKQFVDDLIVETRTGSAVLPNYLTDHLFALKDGDLNPHKEIYR